MTGRRRDRRSAERRTASTEVSGGRYAPLDPGDVAAIEAAAFTILATIGMAEAPDVVTDAVVTAGGSTDAHGRLLFPEALVRAALDGIGRDLTLHGRTPEHDLPLAGDRVHVGTGGAAPFVIDLESGAYRPSMLADLHDAVRLVDRLDNIHFVSRPLVARDMADAADLDVNTAYACLAGTTKHVMTSVSDAARVDDLAAMGALIAGSEDAFRARPFLSLNVNHAVPPLRFDAEACAVVARAARCGIPVQLNTFSQVGASTPVTPAGAIAQTHAETLAGLVWAWLADPGVKAVFGPRPMVIDLRTGAMSGGGGEQALVTAGAVQIARHHGLPCSTIAGAVDAKIADGQASYERCLNVALAAQAGCNLVTQACGMHAGLMAVSFESYVIDNDMLGAVLRSLKAVEVNPETLALDRIAEVVRGEGHFLGEAQTHASMETGYLYPEIADRRSPEDWASDGARDIREVANARARALLAGPRPSLIDPETDTAIRARFDIRLPAAA